MMGLVFFCFEIGIFGGRTVLRMDLYHQYGPLFAEYYDRIVGDGGLAYSWQTGGGGSFLGNFYNYLSSPLAFVLVLLTGHENMPEAIAMMMALKAAFASAFFTYFLKKSFNRHDFLTAAFGVLYSFCGFFIAYYWNVMWIDAMAIFPLVMLGIEKIINNGKVWFFTVSLAVLMFSSYYMGYMTCIFSCIYFFYYYFSHYSFNAVFEKRKLVPSSVRLTKQDKKYIKDEYGSQSFILNSRLLNSGLRFAFGAVMGAALVAFALVPIYFVLKACSATSGTFPTEYKTYFSIFDFIANHFASVDPTIRSSGDDVLPNVYCGVLPLMLVPLYMFCKKITIKEKVASCAVLAIMFASFNINYLNFIWHGFHFPNDLPYRQSFMYCFILVVMAFRVADKISSFTKQQILGAGFVLVLFAVFVQKIGSKNVEELTVYLTLGFGVAYTLVLAMLSDNKHYQRSAVTMLLFCCVIAEAAIGNTTRYSMSQMKRDYTGDYAEFHEVKDTLDQLEGSGIYRMELTNLRTRMDPAWYGYNGVSTFSSMAYEKLSNLQSRLGMFSNYINSYTYKLQTPIYNSMMSMRYIINNDANVTPDEALYTKLMMSSNFTFTAYKNNYWLPIGYCVDDNIINWDHSSDNPFIVQNDYVYQSTGVSDCLEKLEFDHFEYDNINEITDGIDNGELVFFRTINDAQANFTAYFTVEKTQNYYLYLDSSNVKEVSINAGGIGRNYNADETYVLDVGVIEAGETFSVNIPISEGNSGYINLFAYGLNMEKFEQYYNTLFSQRYNVETFEETHISGTVAAPAESVFYTSIPFDPGWSVTVDGVKLAAGKLIAIGDGLLGFKIDEGEHTVEFNFTPKGQGIGLLISVAALFVMLLMIFVLRRTSFGKRFAPYSTEQRELNISLENVYDTEKILFDENGDILPPPALQEIDIEDETAEEISPEQQNESVPDECEIDENAEIDGEASDIDDNNQ